MKKAVIINTDGVKELVEFDNDTSYKTISTAVGGLIECINLPRSHAIEMWVNEEGKLNGLEQNPIATALWIDNYGETDVTVGNVIITGGTDGAGYTLGLNDDQLAFVMGYDKSHRIENLNIDDYTGFTLSVLNHETGEWEIQEFKG